MQPSYALYVVKSGDNLWKIARDVLGCRSNGEAAQKVQAILYANRHLGESGDRIYPGQLLFLETDVLPTSPDMLASDLETASQQVRSISPDEQELLWNNFEALSLINYEMQNDMQCPTLGTMGMSPGSLAGSLGPAFQPTASGFTKIPKHMIRWAKAAAAGYDKAAGGAFGNFLQVSPHSFSSFEGELVRSVSQQVRYARLSNNTLRLIPDQARAFQMGGNVVVAQTQSSGYMAFTKVVEDNKELAGKLKKGGKIVGMGLDLGIAGYNVAQDWDTDKRNYTVGAEATKFVGKQVVSRYAAAPVAAGVCGILTFTTGPGGLVCFVAVYGLTSWGTGALIDAGVDYGANKLYESSHPLPIN